MVLLLENVLVSLFLCLSTSSTSGTRKGRDAYLFYQSVVGTIQVEFPQVVAVSKDQIGLLLCTQRPNRKRMLQDGTGYGLNLYNLKHACEPLTRCGLADGGVVGAEFKAVHAETVEAAMCVDAALRTRVGGCALVDIHTRFPISLQLEAGMTAALKRARARETGQNLSSGRPITRAYHCLSKISICVFSYTKSLILFLWYWYLNI